jgi:hypothetical protein
MPRRQRGHGGFREAVRAGVPERLKVLGGRGGAHCSRAIRRAREAERCRQPQGKPRQRAHRRSGSGGTLRCAACRSSGTTPRRQVLPTPRRQVLPVVADQRAARAVVRPPAVGRRVAARVCLPRASRHPLWAPLQGWSRAASCDPPPLAAISRPSRRAVPRARDCGSCSSALSRPSAAEAAGRACRSGCDQREGR